MKAVICNAPGELALIERDLPAAPSEGWVAIDVSHIGICGTDYHIYEGKHPFLEYPRVMGHELSGTVSAIGLGVAGFKIGDPVVINPYIACGKCVACRQGKPNCCTGIKVLGVHTDGGFAEKINVPAENLYHADGLALRDAAMVEFLAIGAHAVRRSLASGGRALVVGAGPIGIGAAIFARIAGMEVTLLDMSGERLAFGRDVLKFPHAIIGSEDVPARVKEITAGDGFDVVFDATGNGKSIMAGFAHVAHGGAYVLVSVVKDDITFSDPEFHKREMMLIGSRNATRVDFEHVMASIRAGLVPLDALATHATTLDKVSENLPHWAHQKTGLIKAIITV